jgi:hypothetical protein
VENLPCMCNCAGWTCCFNNSFKCLCCQTLKFIQDN